MSEPTVHEVIVREWTFGGRAYAAAVCTTDDCDWVAHRDPSTTTRLALVLLGGEHVQEMQQPPPPPVKVGDYTVGTEPMADFVLARLAEEERPCVCTENGNGACGAGWCRRDCRPCSGGDALTRDEHVLAVCAAMRNVVGGYDDYDGYSAWSAAVEALAAIWNDHPDMPAEG